MTLLLAFIIPSLAGFFIAKRLLNHEQASNPFCLALGFGLGFGLLAQWMLILGMLEISFTILSIAAPFILLIICFILLRKNTLETFQKSDHNNSFKDWLYLLMGFYIFFYLIYIFWRAMNFPIYTWDAMSSIAYKAKVIFYAQSIEHLPQFPHPAYPLHIPFVEAWIHIMLGEYNDQLVKIIFPITAISYMTIQYYFLKSLTSSRLAMFGNVLLISSLLFVHHSTIGYRDTTLAFYNCTTIILMLLWQKSRLSQTLLLAGLFSGLTSFVKLEASGYVVCHLAFLGVMLMIHRKETKHFEWKNLFLFGLPSIGITAIYHIFKKINNITGDALRSQLDLSLEKLLLLPELCQRLFQNFFETGNWNMVWVLFFLSLLLLFTKKISTISKLAIFSVFLFLGFYLTIALIMPNHMAGTEQAFPTAFHHTVLSRILLHFFPLTVIAIILTNHDALNQPS